MPTIHIYTRVITLALFGLMPICPPACHLGVSDNASDRHPSDKELGSILELSTLDLNLFNRKVSIEIQYNHRQPTPAPRMMELFVRHSKTLQFLSYDKGESAVVAQKEVVVQRLDEQTLRIVMYSSSNLNTIDSGRIASLRFRITNKSPSIIELVADRPIFAPPAANEGLILSDGLQSVYFTYFDADGEAYETWDSESDEFKDMLPSMVMVTLEYLNRENPEAPLKVMTSIPLAVNYLPE